MSPAALYMREHEHAIMPQMSPMPARNINKTAALTNTGSAGAITASKIVRNTFASTNRAEQKCTEANNSEQI